MTKQQIKDNAPHGATHYKIYDNYVSYYKFGHRHSFFGTWIHGQQPI